LRVKGRGTTLHFTPIKELVVYDCDQGVFPYTAALSGLLRPGKGIAFVAKDCDLIDRDRCVVCREPAETGFSHDPVIKICKKHSLAWIAWLDAHPEKRAYFAPRDRAIGPRWLEVFLEFVASARSKAQ